MRAAGTQADALLPDSPGPDDAGALWACGVPRKDPRPGLAHSRHDPLSGAVMPLPPPHSVVTMQTRQE